MNKCKVQILMATYNSERYISEQIESIIAQSYQDWQLIIRDDGSKDETCNIVRKYCAEYPDKIKWIQNQSDTHGCSANYFQLIQTAEAEYIMFCDHDDVWLPEKVELTLNKIQQMEDSFGKSCPLLVYTAMRHVDENLSALDESNYLDVHETELNYHLVEGYVAGCTSILNRSLYKEIKQPSIDIYYDYWCALTASAIGKIGFLDQRTILYRQHGNNEIGAMQANTKRYIWILIKKCEKNYYHDYFVQAEELIKCYGKLVPADKKKIIDAFLSMKNASVMKKISVTRQYHFWKSTRMRRIGQMVMLLSYRDKE